MRNRPLKAELKFGYWSRMFIFLIETFHNYHAEVKSATRSTCSLQITGMPKGRGLFFPWDHDLKVSTQLVQTLCGNHALS